MSTDGLVRQPFVGAPVELGQLVANFFVVVQSLLDRPSVEQPTNARSRVPLPVRRQGTRVVVRSVSLPPPENQAVIGVDVPDRRTLPVYDGVVFLDLHGVITRDLHYPHGRVDVQLLPGAVEAVAALRRHPVNIVIVTNQGGIALGERVRRICPGIESLPAGHRQGVIDDHLDDLSPDAIPLQLRRAIARDGARVADYTVQSMREFNECVLEAVRAAGGRVDAIVWAAELEEGCGGSRPQDLKPSAAMFRAAAQRFSGSGARPWPRVRWMVGDKLSDIVFGHRIGAATVRITGDSGPGGVEMGNAQGVKADYACARLEDARLTMAHDLASDGLSMPGRSGHGKPRPRTRLSSLKTSRAVAPAARRT